MKKKVGYRIERRINEEEGRIEDIKKDKLRRRMDRGYKEG